MSDNNEDNVIDPMDDYAICRHVDKLLEEASDYRKRFEPDWKEFEAFYDGRHWNNHEKRPKLNYVFSTVEYEVPILTDSRPGTDVIAIEEEHEDDAKVLKEAIDYVYDFNHINMRTAQAIRQSLISTNHYFYVDYDPDFENGDGQVVIKSVPWRNVYLDPSAGDLDDMSYVIIKRPVKVDLLRRQFPGKADDIEPEEVDIDDMQESTMYELQDRYHGPRNKTSFGNFKPTDMTNLIECWYKDYEMEPIPEEETVQEAQDEMAQIAQGMTPDVSKYLDHAKIISILQSEQSQLMSEIQMRGQMMQPQPGQEMSGQMTGMPPQGMPQDPNAVPQQGMPQDQAMNANGQPVPVDQVAQQQDQMTSDESVILQMLDDLIQQHQIMGEQNMQGMRPKYPHNMRLTVKVGDNVLYDGPPSVDDGMYPLAPFYCYKIDGQPYSTGEIKNILDPQKVLNELFYEEYKGLRLVTNSGWIKDDTSNVDDTTLTNDPGIVVTKKQGTECNRLPPGEVSPQLSMMEGRMGQSMEHISGMTESTQGERPVGVTAASAIAKLQDQAIGRIRLKSRSYEEYTMIRLGKLVASRIIKYWSKPRMLRAYDDSGRIKSVQFDPARLDQMEYVVRVSPGSTVGLSKEAILASAEKLLAEQVIDPEIFMMITDLPYKSLILGKLQEKDQLRQQAQALAQENDQLKQMLQQLGVGGPGSPDGGAPAMQPQPNGMPGQ